MKHRFTLEPYNGKNRYTCPYCFKHKAFTRYIDTETNLHLANNVGKCNRTENCDYHLTPRQYFKANPGAQPPVSSTTIKRFTEPRYNTLPYHYIEDSQRGERHNNFVYFLSLLFGDDEARQLAIRYNIGTANHWHGATLFWQVDAQGKVRTGKIMLYNVDDCKRVKTPYNHIAWAHNLLIKKRIIETFTLRQCLFGEHLLATDPYKAVAICESEKTAVIASIYLPQYIWLAAGSLEGLNAAKCRVLKNRTVILFPDVNGYQKWLGKARELDVKIPTASFHVNDTLMRHATEYDRQRGIDIADPWIDEKLMEWELEREWRMR